MQRIMSLTRAPFYFRALRFEHIPVMNVIRNFGVNRSLMQEPVATPKQIEEVPRGRLLFATLTRSHFHEPRRIRDIVHQMGFKRMHQIQVMQDTPHNRGLVYMARHLLSVKSLSTADIFPQGTSHLDIGERLSHKEKARLFFSKDRREKKEKQLQEANNYLNEKYAHFKQQKQQN
jgi:ribosomal protein L30/L7E